MQDYSVSLSWSCRDLTVLYLAAISRQHVACNRRFRIKRPVADFQFTGTDLSGTSALKASISTKPYFDPEFAQLMLDAGGDINRRDRFGMVAAHDITTVQLLYDQNAHQTAGRAMQWYLEHGGNLDIEDGDGITGRQIIVKLEGTSRTLKGVLDKFEQQRKEGEFPDSAFPKPTTRNGPCPCGSGRKFKKCCGKE